MHLNRKVDLSFVYWLRDLLDPSVKVVDSYPTDDSGVPLVEMTLPTVSVEQSIFLEPFQLGGDLQTKFNIVIDVYAKTKTQRDDIVYSITGHLAGYNVPVYDYDAGFPPDVNPTQIGAFVPIGDISVIHSRLIAEDNKVLHWRSIIDFQGYFTPKE